MGYAAPVASRSRAGTAGTLGVGWLVVAGAVLLVGWLVTGPLESSLDPREDELVRWLADRRTAALDGPVEVLAYLGDTLVVVTVGPVLAVLAWVWTRSWRAVLVVVLANAGERAVYLVATALISRQRPPVEILDPGLVPDHSYPSGHVGAAVVLWGSVLALVLTYRRSAAPWAAPLLLVPLVVLLCRLYQGAHHPSDTVASLVYAGAWLVLVTKVLLADDPRDRTAALRPAS